MALRLTSMRVMDDEENENKRNGLSGVNRLKAMKEEQEDVPQPAANRNEPETEPTGVARLQALKNGQKQTTITPDLETPAAVPESPVEPAAQQGRIRPGWDTADAARANEEAERESHPFISAANDAVGAINRAKDAAGADADTLRDDLTRTKAERDAANTALQEITDPWNRANTAAQTYRSQVQAYETKLGMLNDTIANSTDPEERRRAQQESNALNLYYQKAQRAAERYGSRFEELNTKFQQAAIQRNKAEKGLQAGMEQYTTLLSLGDKRAAKLEKEAEELRKEADRLYRSGQANAPTLRLAEQAEEKAAKERQNYAEYLYGTKGEGAASRYLAGEEAGNRAKAEQASFAQKVLNTVGGSAANWFSNYGGSPLILMADLMGMHDEAEALRASDPFSSTAQDLRQKSGTVGGMVIDAAGAAGHMMSTSAFGGMAAGALANSGLMTTLTEIAESSPLVTSAAARAGAKLAAGLMGEFIGNAGNAAISLSSGVGGYNEARANGASYEQAMTNGIMKALAEYYSNKLFSGMPLENAPGEKGYVTKAIEYVAEKLGKSKALEAFNRTTGGKVLSWIYDKTGEGLEEVVTGLLDPVIDRITYDQEADWKPKLDALTDEFIGGVMLSLLMSGGEAALKPAMTRATIADELVRQGVPEAEARKYAKMIYKDMKAAERAQKAVQEAVEAQEDGITEAPEPGAVQETQTAEEQERAYLEAARKRYFQANDGTVIDLNTGDFIPKEDAKDLTERMEAAGMTMRNAESEQARKEAAVKEREEIRAELSRFARVGDGVAMNLQTGYVGPSDALDYLEKRLNEINREWPEEKEIVKQQNQPPVPEAREVQTPTAKGNAAETARETGAPAQNRTEGTSNGTAAAANNTGADVSDRNGGREPGERTRREAAKLARETKAWRALPQQDKAAGRQAHADDLQLQPVEAKSLGIRDAAPESTVRVYPRREWESDLQRIAGRVEQATGQKVTFILGQIRVDNNGKPMNVRGVNTGRGIIVQADALGVSAEKIATHEAYHAFSRADPALNERVLEQIRKTFPENRLRQIAETYLAKMNGIVNLESTDPETLTRALERVREEICADAYAGINAFAAKADEYTEPARQAVSESRNRQNAEATERRTGPPGEERYSAAEEDEGYIPESAAEYGQLKRQGKVKAPKVKQSVSKSKASIAKADLKKNLLGLYSIPSGSKAELGSMIDALADQYIRDGRIDEEDRRLLLDKLYASGVVTLEADDGFQAVRDLVHNGRIYVPEKVKAEWKDTDYNDFRREAMAEGIWLVNDDSARGWGSWNAELAEAFPGIFDADEYDPREALERIVQVAREGRGEKLSLAEYAAQMAGVEYATDDDMMDAMERQADYALRSFAEKANLELYLKDRTGEKIAQERQRMGEILDQAVQRERARGDKRVQEEHERGERRKERAIETERKWADRLVQAERNDAARSERRLANERVQEERQRGKELLSQERAKEIQRRQQEREHRKEVAQRLRERQAMRELQQKTLKQLQWLSRNQNKFPAEAKKQVQDLLEDMDVLAVSTAEEMHIDNATGKTWKDLRDMYLEAKEKDPNWMPSAQLEKIVMRLDAKKIGDLDMGALQDLYHAAVGLRTELYNRNNLINDELHRTIDEVYENAKTEIQEAKGGYKAGLAQRYADMQLTPMNRFLKMAGWNPDSTWYGMAKGLEAGERAQRRFKTESQRQIAPVLEQYRDWMKTADGQGKNAKWYEIKVPESWEYHMGDKPIFSDKTVTVYMTPAQKVHMYLESKNMDNLRHMEGGRTFADKELYSKGERAEAFANGTTVRLLPETVKNIVSDLTAEEQALANALEQYYNNFSKQEINKVSNILYGYDKAMGGYYAPIFTNDNYTKSEPGVFDLTAEGVGNLKERQHAANPSWNISAFDAFERSVDRTGKFVGLAIPIRNMNTLWNWRESGNSMKDVVSHKWNKPGVQFVSDLMTELQSGREINHPKLEQLTNAALSKYIGATFGFNPSIVLKQFASFPLAGTYLGFDNLAKGILSKAADTDLISKYTGELDYRLLGYATPETATLKNNPNKLQEKGFLNFVFGGGAITWMDGLTVRTLWNGAEQKVKSEQPDLEVGTQEQIDAGQSPFYQAVAKEFEEAVSRSQPMYDTMHRADVMREGDPITRTFTLFKTVPLQELNMLAQTIGEANYYKSIGADKATQTAARQKAGRAFLGILTGNLMIGVISFLNALLKNGAKAYKDKDGELNAESVATGMLKQYAKDAAGLALGGSEAADILSAILFGDKWYGLETPGIEQISSIIEKTVKASRKTANMVQDSVNVLKNGGDWFQYMRDHGEDYVSSVEEIGRMLATYGTGLPVDNVKAYLLGAAQHISPAIKTAYEDVVSKADKSGLNGLTGAALEMRTEHILQDRAGEVSERTVETIARLYEAGYKDAVPATIKSSYTVNGESKSLSAADDQLYRQVWRDSVSGTLDEITNDKVFKSMSQADQTKVLNKLYDYAAQIAKETVWPDYSPDKWVTTANGLEAKDIPLSEWLPIQQAMSQISGKNKKQEIRDYIDRLPYSRDQKKAMYTAEGYQDADDVHWHDGSYGNSYGGSSGAGKAYARSGLRLPTPERNAPISSGLRLPSTPDAKPSSGGLRLK